MELLHPFNLTDTIQWVTGQTGAGSNYVIARWVFLRFLGVVYLIAFVSLWVQIKGLIGSNGILPIQEYIDAARSQLGGTRLTALPTIFWFNASDAALFAACVLGVLASVTLILGFAPMVSLIILWILYLSLTVAGQDFLSFQWDVLLIEAGFLAIFFAPTNLWPGLAHESPVSPVMLFLLWWLLFRLMFESGVVKITSGDASWLNLTAFDYHYFTQPLPTWTSYFMHHLPRWFHALSIGFMYLAEIAFPLLIFTTRSGRLIGCLGMIALQIVIGLTGNYTFFNLLTIVLCLLLVDDTVWTSILPEKLLSWIGEPAAVSMLSPLLAAFSIVLLFFILFVSSIQIAKSLNPRMRIPRMFYPALDIAQSLYLTNSYGLFRVMTKQRPEIIIEGSNDGKIWIPYEFKYKPGDPSRRPDFVEPHQPRLDWQMWFAALRSMEETPWFQRLLVRLLEGSPDVLGLFTENPFPDGPPKYIRARLFEYSFTTLEEKRSIGHWWRREERGIYAPAVSLSSSQ